MKYPSLLHNALSVGVLTLGLTVLATQTVKAAIVTYDFQVSIDFGTLLGNSYNGNLSYEDSTLTGISDEFIGLNSFSLPFQGTTYTLADDFGATADFNLNNFVGATFFASNTTISLTSGNLTSNINDAFFAYDFGAGDQGTGTITYTKISPIPAVPEPSTILGSLTAIGLGISLKNKLRQNSLN